MDSAGASGGSGAPELETLDPAECRRLLGRGGVGRLAMRGDQAPEIRPVNYVLRGNLLIFRTGDGSILASARDGEAASFEIDEIDRLEHTGFSVIGRGRLSVLPTDDGMLALPVRPWASGQKDRFVGLSLDHVTGLRIPPGRGNR
jgi:nitroimidazol reductase NimA-like FMN-containing flavoprotein (pyridoxamine 5'-phosphate oxidase superfamily)